MEFRRIFGATSLKYFGSIVPEYSLDPADGGLIENTSATYEF